MGQAAIYKLLHQRLSEIRMRNPAFSLRAYANRLGFNAGALSAILNGKRPITRKMAVRIADGLALDPQDRAEILNPFEIPVKTNDSSRGHALKYLQLSADQFRLISSWHHFAILSLILTAGFRSKPEWIASRLGITQSEVREALTRLRRLEMIEIDLAGKITRTSNFVRTTDDVASVPLMQSHAVDLELAKDSLARDPVEFRDFTAVTLAINPEMIPDAKERIRKFQDELGDLLEVAPQSEVYKMCIQLFPISVSRKGNLNAS